MKGADGLDFGRASAALKLETVGQGHREAFAQPTRLAFPSSPETPTYVAHSHWGRCRGSANVRIALAARKEAPLSPHRAKSPAGRLP
jgi:hypothetical protein